MKSCQNNKCANYGSSGHVVKRGFNQSGRQMYYCKKCHVRFAETKGTPAYYQRIKPRIWWEWKLQECEARIDRAVDREWWDHTHNTSIDPDSDAYQAVNDLVGRLPVKYQRVIQMVYFQDVSIAEATKHTYRGTRRLSVSGVRYRRDRALVMLREMIEAGQ